MTGVGEVAADIASGAVLGRALSPTGAGHGDDAHGSCPNCSAALIGDFCHGCGQPAHLHRTVGAIGHEIAHGVFHFEGRIWHTLPLLAWRPGELTRRYVHGERAKFVSPLALFLFCVFLMFAVFHSVGGPFGGGTTHQLKEAQQAPGKIAGTDAASDLAGERAKAARRLADLQVSRAKPGLTPAAAAKINEDIQSAQAEASALAMAGKVADAVKPIHEAGGGKLYHINTGVRWFDRAVERAGKNPELLLYKLQSNGYKYSWLLIPLSLPFIWLMFAWHREVTLYDHAIFAIHSLSFMTLLVVALSLLAAVGVSSGWTGSAIAFVPPIHMYRHLKGAYRIGRFGALWRTVWLLLSAVVASVLFVAFLFSMGLSD